MWNSTADIRCFTSEEAHNKWTLNPGISPMYCCSLTTAISARLANIWFGPPTLLMMHVCKCLLAPATRRHSVTRSDTQVEIQPQRFEDSGVLSRGPTLKWKYNCSTLKTQVAIQSLPWSTDHVMAKCDSIHNHGALTAVKSQDAHSSPWAAPICSAPLSRKLRFLQ